MTRHQIPLRIYCSPSISRCSEIFNVYDCTSACRLRNWHWALFSNYYVETKDRLVSGRARPGHSATILPHRFLPTSKACLIKQCLTRIIRYISRFRIKLPSSILESTTQLQHFQQASSLLSAIRTTQSSKWPASSSNLFKSARPSCQTAWLWLP